MRISVGQKINKKAENGEKVREWNRERRGILNLLNVSGIIMGQVSVTHHQDPDAYTPAIPLLLVSAPQALACSIQSNTVTLEFQERREMRGLWTMTVVCLLFPLMNTHDSHTETNLFTHKPAEESNRTVCAQQHVEQFYIIGFKKSGLWLSFVLKQTCCPN